jgi:hypothetical protein
MRAYELSKSPAKHVRSKVGREEEEKDIRKVVHSAKSSAMKHKLTAEITSSKEVNV